MVIRRADIVAEDAYSSSDREELGVCRISVYFRHAGSTHCGRSIARECSIEIACKGFAVFVDTASMTAESSVGA